MNTRTAACAALLALTAALTACSSGTDAEADPAACKAAMVKDFKKAAAQGDKATPADRPTACDGLDDKTVQKLATEVISEQVDNTLKGLETAQP
ncbi:hypothetical protein [Streptomyces sp. Ag109_O5-10]|uniref:hypothetical protein n=1 Tax=Streptomyces sp. Ag109_O5-10 TaxID=1855349 RepID=UPI00089935B5|nr:hypothetical protein [Streptomyces sp. Ag109_O5-10]SEF07239.1 hypothetical protein SAMN05216533_5882 [Streptomyces sp. Ag109_O5-10]